jgi:hypothetical protein
MHDQVRADARSKTGQMREARHVRCAMQGKADTPCKAGQMREAR